MQGVSKARAKHDREVFLNNLCDELETDIGQNRLGPVFNAIRLLSGKRKKSLALPSINEMGLRVSPRKKPSSAGASISYPH